MDASEVEKLERRMDSRLRALGLSDADREDIRQQVFVDYLQNEPSVRNPGAWVGLVAYRKGLCSKYRDRLVPLEMEIGFESKEELRLDVRRALGRSSCRTRELMTRRFLHGDRIHELANDEFGSVSTVKRKMRRAVESLRCRLDPV